MGTGTATDKNMSMKMKNALRNGSFFKKLLISDYTDIGLVRYWNKITQVQHNFLRYQIKNAECRMSDITDLFFSVIAHLWEYIIGFFCKGGTGRYLQ
jgi:hypothetical protein